MLAKPICPLAEMPSRVRISANQVTSDDDRRDLPSTFRGEIAIIVSREGTAVVHATNTAGSAARSATRDRAFAAHRHHRLLEAAGERAGRNRSTSQQARPGHGVFPRS